MRLYHPELDRLSDELPDDEGLYSVLKEAGWCKTIPAEHTNPALAPEQPDVVYQPVPVEPSAEAEAKPRRRRAKPDDEPASDAAETD